MADFPIDYTAVTATEVDTAGTYFIYIDGPTPKKMTPDEFMKLLAPEKAFTQSIPFNRPVTKLAATTVSGALTFTANTTGAKAGFGAIVELTADGTNTPSFAAFEELSTSGGWDNTNGAVNLCIFLYTGTTYIVTISQVSATSLTQLNAPTGLACANPGETTATVSFTDTNSSPNESGYEFYVYDNVGLTLPLVGTFNAAADATTVNITGLTASTQYWVAGVAEGDGVTTANSALSTAFDFTTDASAGLDADAAAYITAEETDASISIPSGDQTAINDFIVAVKAGANVWGQLKTLNFFYGTGLRNAKNLALNYTANGAGTFPTIGATGAVFDGTNDMLHSNIIPNTHLVDNSEHHGFYLKASTDDMPVLSAFDGSQATYCFPRSSGSFLYRIQNAGDLSGGANASAVGRYVFTIRAGGAARAIKDNVQIHTDPGLTSPSAVDTYDIVLGAYNNQGAFSSYNGMTLGIYCNGLLLSDTQMSELDAAIAAFITATSRT